jgi:signal transduction histidine kinase
MESGKVELVTSEITWNKLIDNTIQNYQSSREGNQIRFRNVCETIPMRIRGDETILKRLLNYFFESIIQYAEPESVIEISSHWKDSGERYLYCQIQVEGRNLTPEEQSTLFEPFEHFKKSSQSKEYGGMGWGLAFCKLAASAHRGDLNCTSPLPNNKKGVCFSLSLPSDCERVI